MSEQVVIVLEFMGGPADGLVLSCNAFLPLIVWQSGERYAGYEHRGQRADGCHLYYFLGYCKC